MNTFLLAFLYILVGFFLAVLVGLLMNTGKVKETNKLNRDNVIGFMDAFTAIFAYVVQKDKTLTCAPIPSATAAKQIYNDMLSKFSEKEIVGIANQLLGYTKDNTYTDEQTKNFKKSLGDSLTDIKNKYCKAPPAPGPVTNMSSPNQYNLGPAQYMASGCGM